MAYDKAVRFLQKCRSFTGRETVEEIRSLLIRANIPATEEEIKAVQVHFFSGEAMEWSPTSPSTPTSGRNSFPPAGFFRAGLDTPPTTPSPHSKQTRCFPKERGTRSSSVASHLSTDTFHTAYSHSNQLSSDEAIRLKLENDNLREENEKLRRQLALRETDLAAQKRDTELSDKCLSDTVEELETAREQISTKNQTITDLTVALSTLFLSSTNAVEQSLTNNASLRKSLGIANSKEATRADEVKELRSLVDKTYGELEECYDELFELRDEVELLRKRSEKYFMAVLVKDYTINRYIDLRSEYTIQSRLLANAQADLLESQQNLQTETQALETARDELNQARQKLRDEINRRKRLYKLRDSRQSSDARAIAEGRSFVERGSYAVPQGRVRQSARLRR